MNVFVTTSALLAMALPLTARAQSKANLQARVDQVFGTFAAGKRPGCAVSVTQRNGLVASGSYGWADLEHSVPITSATVFEAGSVSKQFTAAATLLLVQEGKLRLDDDIRRYLPELPDYDSSITIDDLLHHTSGLRDWGVVSMLAGSPRTTRVFTNNDVLDITRRQHSLNYPSGKAFSYTNTGFNLLPIIVARVTGMDFPAFTQARLFKPLGMTSTSWRDDFQRVVPGRAEAYDPASSGWRQDMPFENAYGNGGLLTTTHDLAVWNQALSSGTLGKALSAALAERAHLRDGSPIHYGRGLFLETYRGVPEISHEGATAGYRAWLGRFPEQKLSIALLCNASNVVPGALAHQVADLFLPPVAQQDARNAAPPPGVGGLYVNRLTGLPVRVRASQGDLFIDNKRLEPLDGARWKGGLGEVDFPTDVTMRVRDPTGNLIDYVQTPLKTARGAELDRYVGTFSSDEVGAQYRISNEDGLVLRIDRHPDFQQRLTSAYADAFTGGDLIVRFRFNAEGRVASLLVGAPRVWGVTFTPLNGERRLPSVSSGHAGSAAASAP